MGTDFADGSNLKKIQSKVVGLGFQLPAKEPCMESLGLWSLDEALWVMEMDLTGLDLLITQEKEPVPAQLQDQTSQWSVWFVMHQCLLFSSFLFLFSTTFLLCSCGKGSSAWWELSPGRFCLSAAMLLRPEIRRSRIYCCSHKRQEVRVWLAAEVAVIAHNEF